MPETTIAEIIQRNWIATWAVEGHVYVIAWDKFIEGFLLSVDGLPINSSSSPDYLMGYAHGHYVRNYGPNAG